MDYKEKYEMALEGIQEILGSGEDSIKMSRLQLRLQGIFPELKESEDERIRKEIISAVNIYCSEYSRGTKVREEMLAWLEKQGENTHNKELSELLHKVICRFINDPNIPYTEREKVSMEIIPYVERLEKQGEQKPAWSEEDEKMRAAILQLITDSEKENGWNCVYCNDKEIYFSDIIAWLKSFKPQSQWKPSEEMLEALYKVIPKNVMAISEDEMLLDKLYQGLKYGRVLSKN